MNDKRHSYHSGNTKGLRRFMPGTGDKNQIYLLLYITIGNNMDRWVDFQDTQLSKKKKRTFV